jgi:hypothetical protein
VEGRACTTKGKRDKIQIDYKGGFIAKHSVAVVEKQKGEGTAERQPSAKVGSVTAMSRRV